jgi:hypothetical protein
MSKAPYVYQDPARVIIAEQLISMTDLMSCRAS